MTDTSELSVLCLRIGYVNAEDLPSQPRHFSVWCSQRDVAEAIACSVNAPLALRFDVIYVNSRNRWGYRDLSHSEESLRFAPRMRRRTIGKDLEAGVVTPARMG